MQVAELRQHLEAQAGDWASLEQELRRTSSTAGEQLGLERRERVRVGGWAGGASGYVCCA